MANKSNKNLKPKRKPSRKEAKNLVPKPQKDVQMRVKEVLDYNMQRGIVTDSHVPFASRFLSCLIREQDDATGATQAPVPATPAPTEDVSKTPDQFTPENDKDAFNKAMEPTTDKGEFDTEGVSPKVTSETINSIREWSSKLDKFAEFLNDPNTKSLHKILADGDRAGSLLRGVTRKASDSITRIAGEVEKLKEILNTYIITAPKKLRDTESQVAGWTQY